MAAENESRRTMSSARLRETEGLDSFIIRDPREVLRWKDENPLRLVAAAMIDMRGRAAKKDIQVRVVPDIVALEDWENWWKVVQPAIRGSQHFDYNPRSGTRLRGTKPSDIEAVALGDLSAKSRKTGGASKSTTSPSTRWIMWVQSDAPLPIPRGTPPPDFPEFLSQQPAVLIPTAVARLREGVEDRILNAGQAPKTSGVWIESLSVALRRWVETTKPPETSVAETVTLAMRLSGVLEPRDSYSLIKWLLPSVSESAKASSPSLESIAEVVGMAARLDDSSSLIKWFVAYMSESVENSAVMTNAILINLRRTPRETSSLLQNLHDSLGGPARKDLWRRLITSDSGQISDWLNNRWRTIPAANEKAEVATSLIMASQDADLMGNLDSLLSGEWDFADGEQRQHLFNPILFGWLMRRALMPGCRRVLRELAERVGENGATPRESAASAIDSLMPYFEEFIAIAAKNRLKRQGADYENKLAIERGRLRDTKAELEITTTQLTFLQKENRTKRTVATLEITRDAIIVLGDALQGLATSDVPRSRETGNLESKIVLALSTLDTRPFGEIGEVAPFDPKIHQTAHPPEIETPVKVVAPGLRYSRGNDASAIVVPMKVQREA